MNNIAQHVDGHDWDESISVLGWIRKDALLVEIQSGDAWMLTYQLAQTGNGFVAQGKVQGPIKNCELSDAGHFVVAVMEMTGTFSFTFSLPFIHTINGAPD